MRTLISAAILVLVPQLARPAEVAVFPMSLEIHHPRHPHAIQVFAVTAEGFSQDLRDNATITIANPAIASLDDHGWIQPLANGETIITVSAGGQTKSIPLKVKLPTIEPPSSFRHEVMPILTRAGCNAGACHGYSLGKNGFKLSLRGQEPKLDYPAIVREEASRRVNVLAPERSLLVSKARGDVPHEGGVRFNRGSLADRIFNDWVQQACPDDRADPAEVVSVRMIPDKLVLRPGQKHRIQLEALYTDGTVRDVSRLGAFAVNNTQFAEVTEDGLITAGDVGETAVVGRFERVFAATGVTILNPPASFTPSPVPTDHFIDQAVVEKLNRLKIAPSPVAGDEEFLRRVYLDMIGVQPTPGEVRAFVKDAGPKKREAVVDSLFTRPEFVDQWSLKWGDLLQNSRNSANSQSVFLFREFIRGAVSSNMPLDEFARRILTARGGATEDPASVFYTASKETTDTVERVTQVFCGVRLLCARCHAHPMENWTQADYYGLATFFNQVSLRPDVRTVVARRTAPDKMLLVNLDAGAIVNPRTGKPQPAKFLGGAEPTLPAKGDRREPYAKWLTAPENAFFARGLVNRIWSYYFHRGIIDPVDDIRSTNPPINPALLDALTADFVKHGYDVRQLMRRIVTSATYQRSSIPNESNKHDEQNFSRAVPRRIPAEALLDSLVQATAVPEVFGGAPAGFRAAQLPDANVTSDFLKLFGKPQRMDACECERDNSSNMLQALNFINGKSILARVKAANARPALLLKEKPSDEALVTELYLWSLSRSPNAKEQASGLKFVKDYGPDRAAAAQDLMWALLNSKDFLLVH